MKNVIFAVLVLAIAAVSGCRCMKGKTAGMGCASAKAYTADWESLAKHNEAPDWFRDAKFGIYFHWGVYSVPAFGSEWYPRNMHLKDKMEYAHHLKTYGDPSVFGYHDFVPMFKAEHFDAEDWAKLFKQAGAKFAGPVAEHHDGFSMWASKLTPWNAKDMGPKRDIVGEMEKAIRKNDMKFITTFHHAFNGQHPARMTNPNKYPTGYYTPAPGWPTASVDPKLRMLYGRMPREEFLNLWLGKLVEVIDAYRPDIIWFDGCLTGIPDRDKQQFCAYYFNKAAERNRQVVVTYKGTSLPREVGVEDFEKGRADHLTDYVWLTDDTISKGSWCYTKDLKIKPTEEVLHSLIDIVSKNGVLLLNISPMADGTIPNNQRQVLLEMGQWLKVNGVAIYNTRPWKKYGQGPTDIGRGGHFIKWTGRYTAQDIRFTHSRDGATLYAICLGWPTEAFTIADATVSPGGKAKIALLGSKAKVAYTINADKSLTIQPPAIEDSQLPCKYAYVFKIEGFEIK